MLQDWNYELNFREFMECLVRIGMFAYHRDKDQEKAKRTTERGSRLDLYRCRRWHVYRMAVDMPTLVRTGNSGAF